MNHIHTLQKKTWWVFPIPSFSRQKHNFKGLLSKSIWVSGQELVKNAEKHCSFLHYKC